MEAHLGLFKIPRLIENIGKHVLSVVSDKIFLPEGLRKIDMEAFNKMIAETAIEYSSDSPVDKRPL